MKVLISGSTGLVGSALRQSLAAAGHNVVPLVRNATKSRTNCVQWDPELGNIDQGAMEGSDAVIHLAGENIAARRWSKAQKKRIHDSRADGTRLVAAALSRLEQRPGVLVCASAIGYYGDRGAEPLDEQSPPGQGFLADVCRDWETAADCAREKGIRVVHLRFGMILSAGGGALKAMLLPFRLGLGGVMGSGDQYWSWITIDDVNGAVAHVLGNAELSGPINCVAPQPVTNREFTKTLGRVLKRPTVFPMPAFAARLAFGEMAGELMLASARVEPKRLVESGYEFQHPQLEPALRAVLGK